MYVCVCMCVYVCTYICMYVYKYVCLYACMYIFIPQHNSVPNSIQYLSPKEGHSKSRGAVGYSGQGSLKATVETSMGGNRIINNQMFR